MQSSKFLFYGVSMKIKHCIDYSHPQYSSLSLPQFLLPLLDSPSPRMVSYSASCCHKYFIILYISLSPLLALFLIVYTYYIHMYIYTYITHM